MDSFKSYFVIGRKTKEAKEKNGAASTTPHLSTEMMDTLTSGSPRILGRSPDGSRPSSLYPDGDFRNAGRESILDIKSDIMVSYLYQRQLERLWSLGSSSEGVVLKKTRNNFTACPADLQRENGGFYDQVVALNVKCAMTVSTRVIRLFLSRHTGNHVPISENLSLQVLPSMEYLPRCQKHHFAAFIQDRQLLVVWDDRPEQLVERVERLEDSLLAMIWKNHDNDTDEKKSMEVTTIEVDDETVAAEDLEEALRSEKRPIVLIHAFMVGAMLALLIVTLGTGWRKLAEEIAVDNSYTRLALLAALPAEFFVSLFFMQAIVGNLLELFGPISQMNINSKFFSGKAPRRLNRYARSLPHMTIQMPVYKEGLIAVIQPTILSLKAAISTYELQGGTANIFVNDDGMQLLSPEEGQARREFYEEHSIGWVARPKHNAKPEDGEKVFLRRGKFKKASNMNYALMISNKVEERLLLVQRNANWTQEEEAQAYGQCLLDVLNEEEGRAWADGNIRVGDYILLIDSDTRVPADCLLDAASEMEQCPEVAILQFSSGVMKVTESFFENGITFFTNLIYTAIRFGVSNGDISPFVGHNAVLRWSALQQISFEDEDGYEKFWSESHVSEDFDMSLRLQTEGYLCRLASYTGDGFKEGVSLTVYDELARWEKYAYGCNELLFHPFRFWFVRGPFTPLFRKFLFSSMPFPSKLTILSYIGTYYAIGAAWILTLANYFLIGWYNSMLDKFYLNSFAIYFALIIVFSALGNIALAVLRYRLSEKGLFSSLYENFSWIILLSLFLGGVSLHVSQALLSHFFEIDMSWGATGKEVERTTFFEEMPKLLKKFKYTFIFCIFATALMICGATIFPVFWRINDFEPIYPLAVVVVSHFLLPIALNPALMMFTF
ncbi:MAG: hypothetical protein M1818_002655 [Claussenomyces sp. TS43310]|nr:MAG: hypothetical protein M1818_002655 [Claussenomyces sp. TS43310]